jgi:hypothetical protein
MRNDSGDISHCQITRNVVCIFEHAIIMRSILGASISDMYSHDGNENDDDNGDGHDGIGMCAGDGGWVNELKWVIFYGVF